MRPENNDIEKELYECFSCGVRTVGADTRTCEDCGGKLRNISKPRDL